MSNNRKKGRNESKRLTYRDMSARGVAAVMLAIIGVWWIGDLAVRGARTASMDPTEGITKEGTFKGDPTAPPTEAETGGTKDPREAGTGIIYGKFIPANCVTVELDQAALHRGRLLRLDRTYSYTGYEGDMATFADKNESYSLRYREQEIQPCVVDAMNRLAAAYESETGKGDLLVYSTTAPASSSSAIYPDALPDRATGYCVDLAYLTEDEKIAPMYEGDDWLGSQAYRYGFVQSYSKADETATGIGAAPYHLRYVGKVHAMLMHQEGLTLAEYLERLREHPAESPLTYDDGATLWSVYFVPSDPGKTIVPIPKNGNYEISGNNVDGFIVLAEGQIG